ncbi:MAG: hypothetical protein ISR65_16160 [Bacteriovoracaceae bacterium]|nr:hypothetical protein [Bacteriovoracaceae bacterium]
MVITSKLSQIFVLFVLLVLHFSCVPQMDEKGAEVNCGFGSDFNVYTRSCESLAQAEIQVIGVSEDTVIQPELHYKNFTDIDAQECNLDINSITSSLISVTTCQCIGAKCYVYISGMADKSGLGQFIYQVRGFGRTSDPILVRVEVTPVNDAPTVSDANISMNDNSLGYVGELSLLVDDVDGNDVNNLTYEIITYPNPALGNLALNTATGAYIYYPEANVDRGASPRLPYSDFFTYRVRDPQLLYSGVGRIDVTISPVDDPAVNATTVAFVDEGAVGNSFDAGYDSNLVGKFSIEYSDVEADLATSCTATGYNPVDISPVDPNDCSCDQYGICTASVNMKTYNEDFNGLTSFTYFVQTGGQNSAETSVALQVRAINDFPYIGETPETVTDSTGVILFNSAPLRVYGAEDRPITISGLALNQGNLSDTLENDQNMWIKIVSDNTALVANTYGTTDGAIRMYLGDGNVLSVDSNNFALIPSSTFNATDKTLDIVITPTLDQSTPGSDPNVVNLTITLKDDGQNDPNSTYLFNNNQSTSVIKMYFDEVDDPPVVSAPNQVVTNEGGAVVITDIVLDEGGGPGEDAQPITFKFTTDNPILLPVTNIEAYYDLDDDELADYSEKLDTSNPNNISLKDGVNPAQDHKLLLKVRAAGGYAGSATITITSSDSNELPVDFSLADPNYSIRQIEYVVNPVGAIHQGWKNISAVGPKTDKNNVVIGNERCNYSENKCNSGNSCMGTTSPLGSVTADEINTIFYDMSSTKCYLSTVANSNADWVELKSSCNISSSSVVSTCVGASCVGEGPPWSNSDPNDVVPTQNKSDNFYYDKTSEVCYRSFDANVLDGAMTRFDWKSYTGTSTVTLEWNNFIMAGSGDDEDVSIIGHNIYRRSVGSDYDFTTPLNRSMLSSSVLKYVDTTAVSDRVYFYVVRPVDSKHSLPTATREEFTEIRIISPPANMAFVHRWMVNKDICGMMHFGVDTFDPQITYTTPKPITDPEKNYRCPYSGPGETLDLIDNYTYYDFGRDMLVDLVESGCSFSDAYQAPECGQDGCIGIGSPMENLITPGGLNLIYYDRSKGRCYRSFGTASKDDWEEFGELASYNDEFTRPSRSAFLPPISNIGQESAYVFCAERSSIDANQIEGVLGTLDSKLPTRKEQIAYSSWSNEFTDSDINTKEKGLSLSSGSKCNSSLASGVENGYTDVIIPSTSFLYAIPGTGASGIRSIYTGSILAGENELSEECVSRYGIQDTIGNVMEWVSDLIVCDDDYSCFGLTSSSDANEYQLDPNNNDFRTLDGQFNSYAFDGQTGPCIDLNGDESCDSALGSWKIEDEDYSAGHFIVPMGLPVVRDFASNYPFPISDVSPYLMEIGPTAGITHNALHNDAINVNAQTIMKETNNIGSMATGGSYKSSDAAGRYHFELLPYTSVPGSTASLSIRPVELIIYNPSDTEAAYLVAVDAAAGNDISLEIKDSGAITSNSATITVSSNAITADISATATTAKTLVDGINGNDDAANLVVAKLADPNETTGTGPLDLKLISKTNLITDVPLVFTAQEVGISGNEISVEFIDDPTLELRAETVEVVGNSIKVTINSGVSRSIDIKNAIEDNLAAVDLVNVSLSGGSFEHHVRMYPTNLSGGLQEGKNARADVGFRCVVPVDSSVYDPNDYYHNYQY